MLVISELTASTTPWESILGCIEESHSVLCRFLFVVLHIDSVYGIGRDSERHIRDFRQRVQSPPRVVCQMERSRAD